NKYSAINLSVYKRKKKSQKVDISRPCGGAITRPIAMKLIVVKVLRTVIIYSKFGVDRSIRFCFIGSRISAFYKHLTNGRYNSFALPCSRFDIYFAPRQHTLSSVNITTKKTSLNEYNSVGDSTGLTETRANIAI